MIRALATSVALWAGFVADAGAASPTLERIVASGVLRVGTPGDYRPYTDHDETSGAWRGSDIELARGLGAELGVSIEFVPTSWGALASDFTAGRFDIAVGGISITPDRQAIAAFSRPVARDGKTSLVRCENLEALDELRELDQPSVTVIVNPGGTNERFARARLPRARLVVHRDNLSVFDEVAEGRADAMITDAVEARLQQRAYPGVLCAAHPDRPFDRADKALLLPRDREFVTTVDRWLREARKRGDLQRVQQQWMDAEWQASSRLLALIDARLAVMSDVARAKWNSGAAIEDPAREAELLATLVRQGETLGVPPARTTAFFVAQIAAARELQQDLQAQWRARRREKLPPAPSLSADIRPKLDRISAAMVEALASTTWRDDARRAAQGPLTTSLLSPRASATALAPLTRLD